MTIKKIVILGGGTAGLTSAMIIKTAHPLIDVTIIKSNEIGIIGVGEGTTEHWVEFMKFTNISVNELISETNATFKLGVKFVNWKGDNDHFWHVGFSPYNVPFPNGVPSFFTYFVAHETDPDQFVPSMILDNKLPEKCTIGQYHFDTFKLNDFLQKKCQSIGINIVDAIIDSVTLSNTGYVTDLIDNTGVHYSADFFIDSSGTHRKVMKYLNCKWIDYTEYLPVNHAIAFPTPGSDEIELYTTITAMNAGWKWKIPTQDRYGNGYVFCDDFITVDQAIEELETDLGHNINIAKDIKFGAGRLDSIMKKNCIAIGLSALFAEPLEATSIGASIQQAFLFSSILKDFKENDLSVETLYNEKINAMFDNIVDFIQLHYISPRSDTNFWKNLKFKLTPFNEQTLNTVKHQLPDSTFINQQINLFGNTNWIKIMHGLKLFNIDSIKQQWLSQPNQYREVTEFNLKYILDIHNTAHSISHREYINNIKGNPT
jgi:tryptophan halogenase